MPRFFNARSEVDRINRHVRNDYERIVGQVIDWWEYDPANSTVDTLYDEGGSRMWVPAKKVPTLWIRRVEGVEIPGEEGLYTQDTIHFACLIDSLRRRGISKPFDAQHHLRDRIVWDEFVWDLRAYQIEGRVKGYETVVGVQAVRVHSEEMVNDPQFGGAVRVGTSKQRTIRDVASGG